MSFSLDVKKELSQLKNLANKQEVKYEFLGYLISNNMVVTEEYLKYSTENEYNIDRFAKLIRNLNYEDFDITINGKVFSILIPKKELEKNVILKSSEIFNIINNEKNLLLVRAFVRGLFMGSGSINNPQNMYHVEIYIKNKEKKENVYKIILQNKLNFKQTEEFIYIKDGEEIANFLAFIGANKSVLKFEEIRVQKYMNNKVNRLVNCKTANLNKVLNASIEQIDAINKLKEIGEFEKLDESLKEIANLRLEYPDIPLVELGEKLKNPIGKSGVSYRLKKIIQISKSY